MTVAGRSLGSGSAWTEHDDHELQRVMWVRGASPVTPLSARAVIDVTERSEGKARRALTSSTLRVLNRPS